MRLALAFALLAPAALAQEAPPDEPPAEVALTPTEGQNFAASAEGPLLIVGDEARYDIVLPADILFDFDEAALRPDAGPFLARLREHFAGVEPDQVHVQGHTDSKGSEEHNLTLSLNRATAVCDWLKANTALAVTNCIGRGEMEPVAPNEAADGGDDPEGRQLNRRVTISVVVYPDTGAMMEEAQGQADAALAGVGTEAEAATDVGAQARTALEGAGAETERLMDEAEAATEEALEGLGKGE